MERSRIARCMLSIASAAVLALQVLSSQALAATPAVTAGYDHACGLNSSGGVVCWGDNSSGLLGNGSALLYTSPGAVVGLTGTISRIKAGSSAYHTCAVTSAGALLCWGNNANGQLGNGTIADSTAAAPVSGLASGVSDVGIGTYHTCAVTSGGAVLCWGSNTYGQLGNGTFSSRASPGAVSGLTGVRSIVAGYYHTCALTTAGGVSCWGDNSYGQLASTTVSYSSTPSAISSLSSGVASITSGHDHMCALSTTGGVTCWGDNTYGQLGNGTFSGSGPFVPTGLSSGVASLTAGRYHTCAVMAGGTVRCWGSNSDGQLGDGTFTSRNTPTAVPGVSGVATLGAGSKHTCAASTTGTVTCWGYNGWGQFANGTTNSSASPTGATGLTASMATLTAGIYHTCGLTTGGAALCWGGNEKFELGNGQTVGFATPGSVVSLPSGVVQVSSGATHTCVLAGGGAVWCWGGDGQGQLGIGGGFSASSSLPVATLLTSGIASISSGHYFSCAVTTSGTAQCWGDNDSGQLGNGTTTSSTSPVAVTGLPTGVTQVVAGRGHACARTSAGAVYCWGDNYYGQLGNGSFALDYSTTPVAVQGLGSGVIAIAAGGWHTCALMASRAVQCWGDGGSGQLGNGAINDSPSAVPVTGLSSVASIAGGYTHTCAVTTTGVASCWGRNFFGQLGDGTRTDSSVPVAVARLVSSGVTVAGIAAGRNHTCAVATNGLVACWGYNSAGGVGDGTFARRSKPTLVLHEAGSGSLATNDWFLDLNPSVAKSIPADKIPSYLLKATGNVATAVVNVSASVQFRTQDVGRPIYVFAYVPATLAKGASLEKGTQDCVLAQIDSTGTAVLTSASTLGSLVTGVQSSQNQAVSILNNVLASNINGSTLLVGTGQTGTQAISTGNNQCVATVPPPDGGVVCTCPEPTTTALTASASAAQGATATFTATVAGSTPTGTVQFTDGSANLGAAVALANGVAALPISTLSVGTHAITAAYSGDSGNSPSTSNALTYVVLATSSVTLTATPSPAILGSAVTLRAAVTGSSPTGSVIFRDGTTTIATATVSSGVASTSISSLAVGSHVLTAAYSGDTNNASATSSTFTLQVNAAPPTTPIFTLTPTTYDFGSVAVGSSGSTTVTLSNGGASGTISGITGSGDFSVASNTCGSSLASGASCSITLTFRPSIAGARSGTLSVATNAATSPACQLTGTGTTNISTAAVSTVITGYYQSILGRAPDAGGMSFWSGEAVRVSGLGADVREVFFAMAIQFFNSPEYLGRNTSDTQYLTDLYRTFFNRAPDSGGLNFWLPQLTGGMDRGAMLGNFLFSTEFSTTMTGLFGASNPRAEVNLTMDLYRGILGVLPDSGGFSFWLGQIRAAQCAGTVTSQVDQISQQFLSGAQYQQKDAARPASQRTAMYVGDLYNAFLRRGPDLGGYLFYGGQITSGAQTREQIRQQFLASPEFQARVSAVIAQGCLQ